MPPSGYVSLPGYSDGYAHGSFNSNTTFLHGAPQRSSPTGCNHDPRTCSPAFNVGLNTQYSYSPPAYSSAASPAPSLSRGVLPFAPTSVPQFNHTDIDMDEIITSGSITIASYPGFGVQEETMDTVDDIDDELDDAEEEEGKEELVEVEPEPVPKKKEGKRKWASNAKPTKPHVKWTSKEDECLLKAWKTVSIDPITGVNQNIDTYWGESKRSSTNASWSIHMDRDEKAMLNH
ncbi:putative methionyl-tRNA synthetase [Hordeum vulgare]|nr:putative methionyl-tRNA synthetase [Hordeum vulgare]